MLTSNGLVLTNVYILGPQGEQLEETHGKYEFVALQFFLGW